MNKEELRAAAAVMLAAAEGKKIQGKMRRRQENETWFVGRWFVMSAGEDWDFSRYEYRIAPEPREWWVNPSKGIAMLICNDFVPDKLSSKSIVRVREVIE